MGSRDTAEAVRRHVAKIVDALAAEGLPIAMVDGDRGGRDRLRPGVWVEEGNLTSATVRRSPHASEGDETLVCVLDVYRYDAEDISSMLARAFHDIANVLRQDAHMMACGIDPNEAPARFHTAHPLLVDALNGWGWDKEEAVRPTSVEGVGGMAHARAENGLFTDIMADDVEGRSVILTRRIARRRVVVDSLSIMPPGGTSREAPGILFSQQEGRPLVSISRMVLPDTTMAAIRGRPLGVLLDGGAASAFAHHVIKDAWVSGGGSAGPDMTTVLLEDGEVAMV